MKNFKIKFIGAIIVAIFTILPLLMTFNPILFISPIITGCLFLFIDQITEYNDERKAMKNKRNYIDQCVYDLYSFFKKYTHIDLKNDMLNHIVDQIIHEDVDLNKESIFDFVINNLITGLNPEELDRLFVLSLCYEIDNSKEYVNKSRLIIIIEESMRAYNLFRIDEKTKLLLETYNNYKRNNNDILSKPEGNIDYKELLKEFTKNYCSTYTFGLQIFSDYKKAKEFRDTLNILLTEGKLSSLLLNKKVIDDIKRNLKMRSQESRAFLLVINNYQKIKEVEKSLEKFPQIVIGKKYPKNFPENIEFLHMRLIYPENQHISPKQFLKREILDKIPEKDRYIGFAAILPIEPTDIYSFPEINQIKSDKVKEAYSSVTYLKTGVGKDLTDIVIEYLKSESRIIEILSILPFNIFVPDIDNKVKIFIIKNYDELKSYFKINNLFDWADVKSEDLSKKMISLENSDITTKENWEKICDEIVTEAKKYSTAIKGAI